MRCEKDCGCIEKSIAGRVRVHDCQLLNDQFDLKGRVGVGGICAVVPE